jgi:hypothetical protein
MSESTTRISDLPENIKITTSEHAVTNPSYAPMNIHPNPYGNTQQPELMQLPEAKNAYIAPLNNMPQQTLPSRDIPMDETIYQNDPSIQASYIPPPSNTHDYLSEYDRLSTDHFTKKELEKLRENTVDDLFSELQLPIFIATLFFIFQLPLMNKFLTKYFSFLPLYYTDGNINLYGMILKSFVFGSIFYTLNKTINFLTII